MRKNAQAEYVRALDFLIAGLMSLDALDDKTQKALDKVCEVNGAPVAKTECDKLDPAVISVREFAFESAACAWLTAQGYHFDNHHFDNHLWDDDNGAWHVQQITIWRRPGVERQLYYIQPHTTDKGETWIYHVIERRAS